MPEFEGEFLIGDNGSSDDQLDMLYDFCEKVPYAAVFLNLKRITVLQQEEISCLKKFRPSGLLRLTTTFIL